MVGWVGAALAVRWEVPVVPDADQARRWAEDELARGIYAERTGAVERAVGWLLDRLGELLALGSGGQGWVLPTVLVLGCAAVAAIALVVGGPLRSRRAPLAPEPVFGDDTRTSDELRAAAGAATADGDHARAVLERFRAIVRGLTERGLLADRPGLTAHEAVAAAGARLPSCAEDLADAAALFDGVRYGHLSVTDDDDARIRAVDRRVRAARPVPARPVPVGARVDE